MSQSSIVAIVMPKWGLSMEEGRVNEWLVEEGARIAVGDALLEVETEKIAGTVEATDAGLLRRRVAEPGEVYPVKALLGVMAEPEVGDAEIDAFVAAQAAALEAAAESEPEPRYHFVEVGGRRLRYADRGEGAPPMVLIHGFGGDLDNWLFNIDALAAGRRVLALDLPGHGQSSKEVGDGSLATLAATVVGFLDALGVERAVLVGHSMGAAVAMQVAADAPERVSGLGLIAAVGLGPEIDAEYIAGFVAAASRRELKPWVERLFADRALVTRQLVEDLLRYKRIDGVAEALGGLSRALIDAGQQRIGLVATARASRVPVLVIWGSADAIIPAAHAHALGDAARVVVIDGAGHMVQMEAASKVNAALLEHLG